MQIFYQGSEEIFKYIQFFKKEFTNKYSNIFGCPKIYE